MQLRHRPGTRNSLVDNLILAVLAFIPPLLTSRGMVSADTKTYLYLDPAKLLREATSMWNPHIGNGTVTHQTLGYLWPMGPFFRVADLLRVPDWVAQRVWWGLLVFVAAAGVRRLARDTGVSRVACFVAAASYAFSPYFLQYFARLSGLLLPWAGLPWLLWCVIRARDDDSWKWPGGFALIIGTVGTVNATSLLMVGVGPLLWIAADAITRQVTVRRCWRFSIRAGILSLGVSLWWLNGLRIQGKYGLPILRYTESYETVAKASSPQELLRGLGYWFFYGGDKLGRWVGPSTPYLTRPFVMLAGFCLAGLSLLSISLVRSHFKFHFVFVLVCALGVAVGAAPMSSPSPYGRLFNSIVHNESGFALRSTPRAAPTVLLMLSLGLAFGIDRLFAVLGPLHQKRQKVVIAATLALIVTNFYPWFLLRSTTPSILRNDTLPVDWRAVATSLNGDAEQRPQSTPARTYEFPGSDFANYTWGGTIDPITPGIIKGDYIARELVPYGSDATADLLNAFEARLQEGWGVPSTLGKFARFISANRIVMRNDLQYERFRTPRPEVLWRLLDKVDGFSLLYRGSPTPADSYLPIVDNSYYGSVGVTEYPKVVAWQTRSSRPLITVTPLKHVVVLSGNGDGIVDALNSGLLDSSSTVVYRETLRLRKLTQFDSVDNILVTDTNRKSARRWFSVGSNVGRVERADETPVKDPTDNRLMPFVADPNVRPSPASETVSELVGDIGSISATSYGNQVTFTPEDRPENAFDGDPSTAWRTAVFAPSTHQRISVVFRREISAPSIMLEQPTTGVTVRKILKFRCTFGDSASGAQQSVSSSFAGRDIASVVVPMSRFDTLTFEVLSDSFGKRSDFAAAPGVGLSEIRIPTVKNVEYLRMPTDSTTSPATILMTRRRIDPTTENRFDPDQVMRRSFRVTRNKKYTISGLVRLNPYASDAQLAANLGVRPHMIASRKADGNILASGLNARDGDLSTAWISTMDSPEGSTLVGTFGAQGDVQLTLDVRTGDKYSLPSELRIESGGRSTSIRLPLPDGTGRIVAPLPRALSAPIDQVTVTRIIPRTFPDYFSNAPRVLPVAIRELYTVTPATAPLYELSRECRYDLLQVDGKLVGIRLSGDAMRLLRGDAARFELCGAAITLGEGEHLLAPPSQRDKPWQSGWNIDQVVVSPEKSPQASIETSPGSISVVSNTGTRVVARVTVSGPSLLAFAESINRGWNATLKTATSRVNLGEPFVVNGYSNGWIVPQSGTLVLEWSPQRTVHPLMFLSIFFGVVCLLLLGARRRATNTVPSGIHRRAERWVMPCALLVFAGPIPAMAGLIGQRIRPRWSTLVGATLGGATVSWIVLSQWHYRWPPNLDWPGRFSSVTWLAVAFLVVAGSTEQGTVSS